MPRLKIKCWIWEQAPGFRQLQQLKEDAGVAVDINPRL